MITDTKQKVILRCKNSVSFFIEQFCHVKHPSAGIIPFKLFSYQQRCINEFLHNRFVIFRKVRQSGISTLTGSFALWYGMFFSNKTILIVSKRDEDAKDYMRKNIRFVYNNLPEWMQDLWGHNYNDHSIRFPNGSVIKSMTSSPDTLRSNASSLNIIDEAAFIQHMDIMWAGGQPTLIHGGRVIVVSTSNGIGNWYWQSWEDAESGDNDFKTIYIPWWEMDWKIKFNDPMTGEPRFVAPTDGIRETQDGEEKRKYGPYWSPWLEEQRRQLVQKGGEKLFRQEILTDFIGSGNTVLSYDALLNVRETVTDDCIKVGKVDYANPHTGEREVLDFHEALWIWKKPFNEKDEQGRQVAHTYTIGVDVSSGEGADYSVIQVLDLDTREQVAEFRSKVLPKTLAKMTDFIARMYNNAFVVPERSGIGKPFCDELYHDLYYQNIYKHSTNAGNKKNLKAGQIGFNTTNSSKPTLNKSLEDFLGQEDGFTIYSTRLARELEIYVYINDSGNQTGAQPGQGNNDDTVIAVGLALHGIRDAERSSGGILSPIHNDAFGEITSPAVKQDVDYSKYLGDAVSPMNVNSEKPTMKENADAALKDFTLQLGGISIDEKSTRLAKVGKQKYNLKNRK